MRQRPALHAKTLSRRPHPRRHRGRSFAALALAIGVPAVAAPSHWALPAFGEDPVEAVTPLGFEIPGESFPGSAFYYLEDIPYLPEPAQGVDGQADTPDEVPAGPAARPFVAGGTGTDQARALQCLTMAIYYEAASESDAGQRAVAQVVLNRVAHPAYPSSVCGVVFQGSERNTGCQFTFTCDGSLSRQPSQRFWDRARKVALAAMAGAVYRPVGLATHYHTVWIHPYWADSLTHVGTIGAHRFYRWKGQAGQPRAFTAAYAANEPAPVPKKRGGDPSAAPAVDDPVKLALIYEQTHPLPLAQSPGQSPAQSLVQSSGRHTAAATGHGHTGSGEAIGGNAPFAGSRLPASGDVREEYARSGQWLAQP